MLMLSSRTQWPPLTGSHCVSHFDGIYAQGGIAGEYSRPIFTRGAYLDQVMAWWYDFLREALFRTREAMGM